jgi:hypothetical protein
MNELFIPYEQALELKELGFDGDCFAIWSGFDEINFSTADKARLYSSEFRINDTQSATFYINDFNSLSSRVSAPTFSQAFKWFREKYKLFGYVLDNEKEQFYWGISELFSTETLEDTSEGPYFETYEEAELECLVKLIEIVQNEKR